MLMIGHKPKGCHTEQHDVFFTIADCFLETEKDVRAFKPESEKIHIDAWREVTRIGLYRVLVIPKGTESNHEPIPGCKAFFINLGGYKEGEFNEFHYPMVVVAHRISDAQDEAKDTAFFKHTKAENAPAHIDDKYGVDVDDVYAIEDILPEYLKKKYSIVVDNVELGELERVAEFKDEIHLGYQKYEKMKK